MIKASSSEKRDKGENQSQLKKTATQNPINTAQCQLNFGLQKSHEGSQQRCLVAGKRSSKLLVSNNARPLSESDLLKCHPWQVFHTCHEVFQRFQWFELLSRGRPQNCAHHLAAAFVEPQGRLFAVDSLWAAADVFLRAAAFLSRRAAAFLLPWAAFFFLRGAAVFLPLRAVAFLLLRAAFFLLQRAAVFLLRRVAAFLLIAAAAAALLLITAAAAFLFLSTAVAVAFLPVAAAAFLPRAAAAAAFLPRTAAAFLLAAAAAALLPLAAAAAAFPLLSCFLRRAQSARDALEEAA